MKSNFLASVVSVFTVCYMQSAFAVEITSLGSATKATPIERISEHCYCGKTTPEQTRCDSAAINGICRPDAVTGGYADGEVTIKCRPGYALIGGSAYAAGGHEAASAALGQSSVICRGTDFIKGYAMHVHCYGICAKLAR